MFPSGSLFFVGWGIEDITEMSYFGLIQQHLPKLTLGTEQENYRFWKSVTGKNSIIDLSRCQYASEQCSHARTYIFHNINFQVNPLSANPTKWSNTFKLFVANCRRITWVCLNILWGWRLRVNIFFSFPLISLFENTQSHRKMKGGETTFLGENEEI